MDKTTIRFGISLIVIGAAAYFGTGMQSITALIPSFFGIALAGLGYLASSKENLYKHAMHGAAVVGLLGFLGSVGGVPKVFTLLGGGDVARPQAVIVQAIMAVVMLVFLVLCVQSFMQARRERNA
ncbi:MAG: hypothetical protein AAFP70_00845 [Calditrichota bacterium]